MKEKEKDSEANKRDELKLKYEEFLKLNEELVLKNKD